MTSMTWSGYDLAQCGVHRIWEYGPPSLDRVRWVCLKEAFIHLESGSSEARIFISFEPGDSQLLSEESSRIQAHFEKTIGIALGRDARVVLENGRVTIGWSIIVSGIVEFAGRASVAKCVRAVVQILSALGGKKLGCNFPAPTIRQETFFREKARTTPFGKFIAQQVFPEFVEAKPVS